MAETNRLRNSTQAPDAVFVGLDIGGTKLAAGLVTPAGEVLLQAASPTEANQGGPAVLERALELVGQLILNGQRQGLSRPLAIGLAAAGRIDTSNGKVVGSSDLIPAWTGLALTEAFEGRFGLPSRADNDVNALALAESRFGAGQGYSEALFIAAGTGLGGGLIINGQMQRGANYCAGEVGHTLMTYEGWPCECGRRGCLEQYTASAAIKRFYYQNLAEDFPGEPLPIQAIARQAAADQTGPAAQAFEEAGGRLGLGLASLVCITDPQIIIIGGGLVAASPLYFAQVCAAFKANAWPAQAAIPVERARLGGQAAIIGAAALVFDEKPLT
jgi:glucokinase